MPPLPEALLPPQVINNFPVSGWNGPSISAPNYSSEASYAAYTQHITPHTSSETAPPPTFTFENQGKRGISDAQCTQLGVVNSPSSIHSGDSVVPISSRPSEEPQGDWKGSTSQSATPLRAQSHFIDKTQNGASSLHHVPNETCWSTNPLGIHSSQESYYPAFPTIIPSPRVSEPLMERSSNPMSSPQPRRIYTPIAPLPVERPKTHIAKRSREKDDDVSDDSKKRIRSDSIASTQLELSEEDKLLLQLKEEESMPWKDIAARFQSELGKNYQIPALQMRLKRLRERMRVWTDVDVKALRLAHDYWEQSKFEIIAHKMLEFGVQDKWTARQCARKWATDIEPVPYAHFEYHIQQGFAPYAMSPIEPPSNCLPFLHV